MPVKRCQSKNGSKRGFYQISNEIFQYKLSPNAFQVYSYAMSQGENWIFHQAEMLKNLGWPVTSKRKLNKALQELKKAGLASGGFAENVCGENRSQNTLTFYAVNASEGGAKCSLPDESKGAKETPSRVQNSSLSVQNSPVQGGQNAPLTIIKQEEINNINNNTPPFPPKIPELGESEEDDIFSQANHLKKRFTEIVRIWQAIFPDGPRTLRGRPEDCLITTSPLFQANASAAIREGFTSADYQTAFETLQTSSFNWQIHSAVKPENLRLLLTQAENEKKQRGKSPKKYDRLRVANRSEYRENAF